MAMRCRPMVELAIASSENRLRTTSLEEVSIEAVLV
jgi:hypothetical protein